MKRSKHDTLDKDRQLYGDLNILLLEISTQKQKLEIVNKRVLLSIRILKQENKMYYRGRATLNDLIIATTQLDNIRLKKINLTTQIQILEVEWLRLTDQLVQKTF